MRSNHIPGMAAGHASGRSISGRGPWRARFVQASRRAGLLAVLLMPAASALAADITGHVVNATFGPDGRLWRVLARGDFIEVDVSADLGASFRAPVRVNREPQRIRVHPEGRPQVEIDGEGGLFVAWNADDGGPAGGFFSHSADDGQTFSAPVAVASHAGPPPHLRLRLRRSARGPVMLAWLDPSTDDPASGDRHGILYAGRLRGAATPTLAARRVTDGLCECCRLDMAALPDGDMGVVGRMVYAGMIRDIGLLRIDPDARLIGQPVRLTRDEWQINACPEHGPALSPGVDGRLHFAWFTQGTERQGSFYAYADRDGRHVAAPLRLGDPQRLASHADVMASDERVVVAWREYDGERNAVWVRQSADQGRTWSPPRVLESTVGAADYPLLLALEGRFYVSWNTVALGYRLMAVEPEDGA